MRWKKVELAGWGRVRRARSLAARPERLSDLSPLLDEDLPRGLSVYAGGRAYGDSALNTSGHSCLTTRLDRILSFDEESGVVAVEPGVTFGRLMEVFLPRGWLVPVTPGTSFVTIGGAVAHDVHGKNHEREGTFGQHVVELDVMTADGRSHTIAPDRHPEWFQATCGGCGLTGLITRIVFRMERVPSAYVNVVERRIGNLDAFLAAFEDAKYASYSVGWIDALAGGAELGRGILETAEPARDAPPQMEKKKRSRAVPFDFPNATINPLSVRLFNHFYYNHAPKWGRERIRHYGAFLYPLDAIHHWNRIYGRRGFHQFQCVVPYKDGQAALRRLLELISARQTATFLTVLKRMGPGRRAISLFRWRATRSRWIFPTSRESNRSITRSSRLPSNMAGAFIWPRMRCSRPTHLPRCTPSCRRSGKFSRKWTRAPGSIPTWRGAFTSGPPHERERDLDHPRRVVGHRTRLRARAGSARHSPRAGRARHGRSARDCGDVAVASGAEAEPVFFDAVAFASHAVLAEAWGSAEGALNVVLVFGLMPEQGAIDADPALAHATIDATFTGAVSILHHLAPHLERRKNRYRDRHRARWRAIAAGSRIMSTAPPKRGFTPILRASETGWRAPACTFSRQAGLRRYRHDLGIAGAFPGREPEKIARTSLAAAAKGKNVCYVPGFWRLIMLIIRAIPERIFKRLSI
jgi:decaprenylphospho-beta-D-ribofuranose 2-oxidase